MDKYPSTPHLPFSPAQLSADDVKMTLDNMAPFLGSQVVITEKMDGGNCCIKQGKVYARTHGHETKHEWFSPIKSMARGFQHLIPDTDEIYGENMTAVHSIEYDGLDSNFYLFGVCRRTDDGMQWLSWPDVVACAEALGVPTVPVLFEGSFETMAELEEWMTARAKQPSRHDSRQTPEGFVVRLRDAYDAAQFDTSIAKYVRANHVQTADNFARHWKKAAIRRT